MHPIRTILYATDFSEPAQAAFGFADALARDYGAGLVVLYVDPPPRVHGEVVAQRQPDYDAGLWRCLESLRPQDPATRVERLLVEGDPVEEILHTATATGADLIVVGTHGRGGLGRLVLGSVAEQILRRASCPVVTIKPPSVREQADKPCTPHTVEK